MPAIRPSGCISRFAPLTYGALTRLWTDFPFRFTRHVDLALCRHLGLKLRRLHSYDLFLSSRSFDIAKARNELGYRPRIPAADGLSAMVEEFVEEGSIDSREGTR